MAEVEPQALSSREEINRLINLAKKARVKILFVQVYRGNKAWFSSRLADPTPYEKCLKGVSEDPLKLLIKEAHRSGIEVHAWLNMLSLGSNKDARMLKKYGIHILTRNPQEKNNLEDYKIDNQYFLEPGDTRVRNELSKIIEEILGGYPDLDGIQFDYVRYPDKNPDYGYTEMNMERFKKTSLAWEDWKRAQVTETLEHFVRKARQLHPGLRVSATGCMPYQRAYYEAYQDWPSWLNRGLLDFVTIMDYSPDPSEFERWILAVKGKVDNFRKVNIGIGAYKLTRSPEKFEEELRFSEGAGAGESVIFHYASLLENSALINCLEIKPRR